MLTYPRLVKELYENLSKIASGISSTVKQVEISLSDTILEQKLNIPSDCIVADRLADRRAGLECVLDRMGMEGITEFKSNTLSTDLTVLHHIIWRIFVPKDKEI